MARPLRNEKIEELQKEHSDATSKFERKTEGTILRLEAVRERVANGKRTPIEEDEDQPVPCDEASGEPESQVIPENWDSPGCAS